MLEPKHPIGLLGGTFDPIHKGHIEIAEYLIKKCDLGSVHFIPCRKPPHRRIPQASAQDRLAMVKIAIANYPHLIANDIEVERPGPSYTIDTLKILRALIPTHPLCFIIGEDAFVHFNQWLHYEKILELTHIIIVKRPGYSLLNEPWANQLFLKRLIEKASEMQTHMAGKIFVQHTPISLLSATQIRKQLSQKKATITTVPDSVQRYIEQHHLY